MSTTEMKDFRRRLQRAAHSQSGAGRQAVVDTIRFELGFSGSVSFPKSGVLVMETKKRGDTATFRLNAFTGKTTHPEYAQRLAARALESKDFRKATEPDLNAHLFRLDPGVYTLPTLTGPTFLKVNHPVSGYEMIEHYLSDPNPEDPLVGLDVEKLTAPGGPAEIVEIRNMVRWVPEDVKESKEIFDHQMGRGRSPTETPQFS